MPENNDDTLLLNDVFEDKNFEEWYYLRNGIKTV